MDRSCTATDHPAADHRTKAGHRGTARPDSTPRQATRPHDPREALATSTPTQREPARDRDKHYPGHGRQDQLP